MNNGTKKFFIYARKSTESEDRQVRSIGDQLAELRELARKEDLHIVAELTESQTAKTPGRPIFNDMLTRIEKGEASGILACHPDRLARNSIDGGRLIYLVDTGAIKELRFSTFWFEPTPQGKFMLAIAFGQSKYYVDNLSENIKRGKRRKLKDGLWPQFAPLGYINDQRTRGITPDAQRAQLVRKAFEVYATGDCPLDRLTASMNGLGLTSRKDKPLSRTQYHRLLQNPIYYGLILYRGELHEGKHDPLITKSLFDQVQTVLRGRGHRKERLLKPYTFRRMFHCGECGCFITTETQKGFNYLRCTKKKGACSQPYTREEEISTQVDDALASIAVPQSWIQEMLHELEEEKQQQSTVQDERLTALHRALAQADAKLERLTAAYLEEALSLSEYREMKNKLVQKKAALREQVSKEERNTANRLEPTERFVKALHRGTLLASTENTVEKAKFLKSTGSNLTIHNRKLLDTFPRSLENR